jgi:hydroxyethylthiazole kinase
MRLMRHYPSIIRGNASEIIAVARLAGLTDVEAAPKGVDAANSTEEAESFAAALAKHLNCVVAATGEVDILTDGTRLVRLANGHPIMPRVTAIGCALSATAGAFAAVADDMFQAVTAAIAVYGVVGDMAADGDACVGPGTFRLRFIDQLAAVSGADITLRLKVAS